LTLTTRIRMGSPYNGWFCGPMVPGHQGING
jgi:hypothetical protein